MRADPALTLRVYVEGGTESEPHLLRWSTWRAQPGNFDSYALLVPGTPVLAAGAGLPARGGELEGEPDGTYEDGAMLPGGLQARKIAGRFAGDTVLEW